MEQGREQQGSKAGRAQGAFEVPRLWLVAVALAGETALAAIGLATAWLAGSTAEISWALSIENLAWGTAVALGFAALLFLLLRKAPAAWPFDQLRRLSQEVLRPLFASARPVDLVIISLAAGFGEEILFRGALQPLIGLVPSSIVFGLCHLAGRDTIPLAIWAGLVGVPLGALMNVTGGLAAPITAHAVYDLLALACIRSYGAALFTRRFAPSSGRRPPSGPAGNRIRR